MLTVKAPPRQTVRLSEPDTDCLGVREFEGQLRVAAHYTWRDVRCLGAPGLRVKSPKPQLTRIAFLLNSGSARAEFSNRPHAPMHSTSRRNAISVVPVGDDVWAKSDRGGWFELSSLAFDAGAIAERWGEKFSTAALATPRLNLSNERLWALGRRLAEESQMPGTHNELYFDSCVLMLIVELLRLGTPPRGAAPARGLSRQQLRRVTEFIEDNLSKRISLAELARLSELSASHFAHAFKQSTGLPPHRWQLDARIRRSQQLLLDESRALSAVAMELGFADQSHFTRVFRSVVGVTPRAWRCDRSG